MKWLICVVAGHRWKIDSDESEAVLILECKRCGHEEVHSSETFDMESWLERAGRAEIAESPYVNPRWSDPRFIERRKRR